VGVTLVQDAEDDVDRDQGSQNQPDFIGQRVLKSLRCSLKTGLNAVGESDLVLCALNGFYRFAQRYAGRKIERKRDYRKLALVIDSKGSIRRLEMRERAQGHLRVVRRVNINVVEGARILLKIGRHFQNHVILIELREDG